MNATDDAIISRLQGKDFPGFVAANFDVFMEEVIGLNNEPFHNELDQIISNPLYKKIAIAYPRGHGKSTHLSVGYPLWEMAKNRNVRILIVSSTSTIASGFITEILNHIEGNDKYADWSKAISPDDTPVHPKKRKVVKMEEKWSGGAFTIDRPELSLKDPTVQAIGLFGSSLSKRADVIICDDIVNQENSETEEQRQKIKDWVYTTVMPILVPGGRFIYLGNTWHCFPGYVKIDKKGGSANISTIKVGDLVRTHSGNYHIVKNVMSYENGRNHSNERLILKTKHQEIRCTPEHPFLVGGEFISAKNLKVGDILSYPKKEGHAWTLSFDNKRYSRKHFDPTLLTKDLAFLFGMYIGDGWIGGGKRISIIVLKERQEDLKRLIDAFSIFGQSVISEGTSDKTQIITFHSTVLANFVDSNFGHLATGKKIPEELFNERDEIKAAFIYGMIRSDGSYKNRGGAAYFSVNERLIRDFSLLLSTLDISHSPIQIRYTPPNSFSEHPLPKYQLSLSKFDAGKLRTIESEEYTIKEIQKGASSRKVYNLEVDVDNSFIANGFSVHNCDDLVANLLKDPLFDYRAKKASVIQDAVHQELWQEWANIRLDDSYELPVRLANANTFYTEHKTDMEEGVELMWPNRFTYQDLYLLRMQNPYMFARMYQCDPSKRPDQKIKDEWLEKAIAKGRDLILQDEPRQRLTMRDTTAGLDLAISQKKGSDDTVFLTLDIVQYGDGSIEPGDFVIRNIERGKYTPAQVREMVVQKYSVIRHSGIRVESVQYQESMAIDLSGFGLPIKSYATGKEKNDPEVGVYSLANILERGKFVIPYNRQDARTIALCTQLMNELRNWPDGHTGDSLMSLWFAYAEIRSHIGKVVSHPRSDFDEKRDLVDSIEKLNLTPEDRRKEYEKLADLEVIRDDESKRRGNLYRPRDQKTVSDRPYVKKFQF
jgi:hypothetical protein